MKELEEKGEIFTIDDININSIFFADDSITIARSMEVAKRILGIIKNISKKFGLIVNEEKSKILIFKKRNNKNIGMEERNEEINELKGIEVVRSIKYQGMEINDGIDIFENQKKE